MPVQTVWTRPYEGDVYNVEVEDLHCYAVGNNGALVHNSNNGEGGAGGKASPSDLDGPGTLTASTADDLQGVGDPRFATTAENASPRAVAPGNVAPRAKVVGVPESSDVVTLWKAPGKGRTGAASEVTNGFDPAKYPGDGPYFATDKSIAESFQRSYGNGLQEINIPRSKFDELVNKGVIKVDGYYDAGKSWHVPADRLAEFNEAIGQGPANQFHP